MVISGPWSEVAACGGTGLRRASADRAKHPDERKKCKSGLESLDEHSSKFSRRRSEYALIQTFEQGHVEKTNNIIARKLCCSTFSMTFRVPE
jgi:hypothetical protein